MNLHQRRLITRRFLREALTACLGADLAPVALVYVVPDGPEDVTVSLIANRAWTDNMYVLAEALREALAGLTAAGSPSSGPDSFGGIPIGPDGAPLAPGAPPPEKPARQAVLGKVASAGAILVGGLAVHTMACPLCGRRTTLGFGSPAEDLPPAEDADLYAVCFPCRKAVALFRSMPPPYSPWPKREGWQEGGGGI